MPREQGTCHIPKLSSQRIQPDCTRVARRSMYGATSVTYGAVIYGSKERIRPLREVEIPLRALSHILHESVRFKKPEVLILRKTVGHACKIITDGALQAGFLRAQSIALGKLSRGGTILSKEA